MAKFRNNGALKLEQEPTCASYDLCREEF
jgi:hypothetical protein